MPEDHSHGAVRVEYYAERISKAAPTANRSFVLRKPDRARQFYMPTMPPDRSRRKWVWNMPSKPPAKGVAVVGISRMGHSGAISYFVQQAARAGLIGISLCQSDPMVVPFGGAEIYYGTNPLALPRREKAMRSLPSIWRLPYRHGEKYSTPARAICLSRMHGQSIKRCTNNRSVRGTCSAPRRWAKGYGLMMMIDVLSGVLLGLPFGRQVSSMYDDLHAGRNLGQLHIVINPNFSPPANYSVNILARPCAN